MKNILSLLLVFCAFTMSAQVSQVSGNQSGTWSGDVHIVGDVIIPANETLTINAGTSVISDGYFEITVLGNLYADGDENAPITFTVADTTGFSNYDAFMTGAWKGFLFQKSGSIRLSYCDFSYGKTALDADGGMMRINMVYDFIMKNCSVHHNVSRRKGGAIYAENSTLYIHDTEVYENICAGYQGSYTWGAGFQFFKCNINMHDMVFHDNNGDTAYGGGMNIDSCNMELKDAVFYNNYAVNAGGFGIQRCKDYSVKVANVLAYNNSVRHYGGGLAIATSDPELNNLTIVNNYCGGGGGAGMQMYVESNPVLKNCIFWGNHAVYEVEKDTVEYYMGSQIWLWGEGSNPAFYNGVVQYGLDSINCYPPIPDDHYIDMIEINPLFIDEVNHDYRLTENSPCVNTGIADLSGMFLPDHDLDGNPRVCGSRIDMGCYELCHEDVGEIPTDGNKLMVYPNPLNDNAFCVVNLDKKSDVKLSLISLDGKEIYREDLGVLEAGENRISLENMLRNIGKTNRMYLLVIDNQSIKIVY